MRKNEPRVLGLGCEMQIVPDITLIYALRATLPAEGRCTQLPVVSEDKRHCNESDAASVACRGFMLRIRFLVVRGSELSEVHTRAEASARERRSCR